MFVQEKLQFYLPRRPKEWAAGRTASRSLRSRMPDLPVLPVSAAGEGSIVRTSASGASGRSIPRTLAARTLITPSRRSSRPAIVTRDAVRTASR